MSQRICPLTVALFKYETPKTMNISCLYNSLSNDETNFLKDIQTILQDFQHFRRVFFLGSMNLDHSECSTLSRNLNTINEKGLSQNFSMPARITENLSGTIDPLIHNSFFRSSDSVVNKLTSTVHSRNYTVKLARAKLPANAGNFTCSSQVKRFLAQFTCVTCSLPVNTDKFTCFEAASTSRRTHANCLRGHVNLPEYHRHFRGSFTCGTNANLPATSMQNCLLLQAKIHATYRQKH